MALPNWEVDLRRHFGRVPIGRQQDTVQFAWRGLLVRSDQSAVAMRIGAGLTSAKLTPFPRSSATSGATDSKYLFGAKFSLHRKKITPNRLRRWSILISFVNCCFDPVGPHEEGASPRVRDCGMAWEIASPGLTLFSSSCKFCRVEPRDPPKGSAAQPPRQQPGLPTLRARSR